MKFNYKRFIISLALPQLAGIIGSLFTTSAIPTWYATLPRPSFSPPNWIFGPVWIILYILMGVSVYLIWQKVEKTKKARGALWLFWIHLFFNSSWSIIFFGLQSPGWALIDIAVLWLAIVGTIIVFYKISRPAALLLLPYILWVSFAGYLNYSIWTLNQETPVAPDAPVGAGCTMDTKECPDGSYVGRVPPNCEFVLCPGEMEWLAIKQAIANCEVESVWQTHARTVEAKLKNGEKLAAVEPKLDDIIDLAIAAEPECGKILMGTE